MDTKKLLIIAIAVVAVIAGIAAVAGSSSATTGGSMGGSNLVAMYENNDCAGYHKFLKETPMKEIKENLTPAESIAYGKLVFSCGPGDTFSP